MTAKYFSHICEGVVGVEQEYIANVSGGEAPYSYSWDINGDDVSDGSNSSITVTHVNHILVTLSLISPMPMVVR